MKGTKWLGEIIKEEGVELGSNTLIIAPTGSGKTHYILNDLCKGKKCLYLCDTRNLKYAVTHDIKDKHMNIKPMSYHEFGLLTKNDTANKLIESFDLIICDEVHNLINYQGFTNEPSLVVAQLKLFSTYEKTKIVMFTATPQEIDKYIKKYDNGLLCNFKRYDFRHGYDIKQYANIREAYIGHFSDIERQLYQYKDYFKLGYQCLIFTSEVRKMIEIEDICKKLGLRPISIWSLNNDKNKMNNEQQNARKHLLEHCELSSCYDVLIINRASETGINIENWDKDEKPHKMNLMICHATDETQQIQARGRIRHDIQLLTIQTKDTKKLEFEMDEDLLNEWWEKDIIQEFVIVKNNLRDDRGRLIGMRELPKRLEQFGYDIVSERRRNAGKKVTMYKISKK